MKIPHSWAEVTIAQFQEINRLDKKDEMDYLINSISVLCDAEVPEVEALTLTRLREINSEMKFLLKMPEKFVNQFKIDVDTYIVDPSINHITAGQYIDLNKYIQDGVEENLHKIMTCFCFPTTKRFMKRRRKRYGDGYDLNELAAHFQYNATMDVVYPLTLFFCTLISESMPGIQDYLLKELKTLNSQVKEKHSTLVGAGLA